jgi:hypothetical protein
VQTAIHSACKGLATSACTGHKANHILEPSTVTPHAQSCSMHALRAMLIQHASVLAVAMIGAATTVRFRQGMAGSQQIPTSACQQGGRNTKAKKKGKQHSCCYPKQQERKHLYHPLRLAPTTQAAGNSLHPAVSTPPLHAYVRGPTFPAESQVNPGVTITQPHDNHRPRFLSGGD